jgi:hypothetical protein
VLSLVAGVACSSEEASEGASPEEIVDQFTIAVLDDDLVAVAALLDPDVVHSEFVQNAATEEREQWATDIVGRDAVVGLYDVLTPPPGVPFSPMPPQSEAIIDPPDTVVTEDRMVVQTRTLTHSTGFFRGLIVETTLSEAGLIEHLSVIHVESTDGIDEPSASEAADFLNAIYGAHGLPAPVDDPEGEYAFYRGNPPCQKPNQGVEGNDPEVLAAQLDVLATDESPVWLMAGQALAEARAYCPARFWAFRDVVEAAIGNTDSDSAYEWAMIPIP